MLWRTLHFVGVANRESKGGLDNVASPEFIPRSSLKVSKYLSKSQRVKKKQGVSRSKILFKYLILFINKRKAPKAGGL